MRQTLPSFARLWLALGLVIFAAGCGATPLASTRDNAADVARAVLQAIQQRDRAALLSLALSETEFEEHVWPELPAARPERNLPLDYVWNDLRQKSEASLAGTLARHGGQTYEFLGVRFAGAITNYASYDVYREAVVQVRLEDGSEIEVKLFGSMIQKQGRWKVFSYVVDQ